MADAFRIVAIVALSWGLMCAKPAAAGQLFDQTAPRANGNPMLTPVAPSVHVMTGYPSKLSAHTEQQMRGYTGSGKVVQGNSGDETAQGPAATLNDDSAKPLQREHPRPVMQVDHRGVTWAFDNEHGVWRNLSNGLTQLQPPPS